MRHASSSEYPSLPRPVKTLRGLREELMEASGAPPWGMGAPAGVSPTISTSPFSRDQPSLSRLSACDSIADSILTKRILLIYDPSSDYLNVHGPRFVGLRACRTPVVVPCPATFPFLLNTHVFSDYVGVCGLRCLSGRLSRGRHCGGRGRFYDYQGLYRMRCLSRGLRRGSHRGDGREGERCFGSLIH